MIIDFHAHIFPKTMRENRENYFADELSFELLYRSPKSKIVGAKTIIDAMDEQGIDKSVVFGFPWKNSKTYSEHNDYIMNAVARYPDRLVGLCCFDPSDNAAATEVHRCFDGGLSGVGELAFYQSGLDEAALNQLAPIMEICRRRDLPVLIHTNEPVGHIYPGKAPNTLGQIYDPVIYRHAVGIFGSEKILFGSDFPLLKPSKYFEEMGKAGLPKDQIESICGLNAKKLLNL